MISAFNAAYVWKDSASKAQELEAEITERRAGPVPGVHSVFFVYNRPP